MTIKEFMSKNDNINVVIERPYGEETDWAACLYEGPLYDVPHRLRKDVIIGAKQNPGDGLTYILLDKTREYFKVTARFHADLEDVILNRAAEFGLPPGSYIKKLVMNDLEKAKN